MRDALVIGAGWAGLSAAAGLRDAGLDVQVLEKARGPGGRSATRRDGEAHFDHGAQYFTARSQGFGEQVERWCRAGLAAEWRPRIRVVGGAAGHRDPESSTRYVGVPGMNAICHDLASGLDCRFCARVASIARDSYWRVGLDDGTIIESRFLVVTCPAPQALALLGHDDPLAATLASADFRPCISVMTRFAEPIGVDFDAAFVNADSPLSWVARNADKPGRAGAECWVLHATGDWSRAHLERDADTLARELLAAFAALTDVPLPESTGLRGHRWRYAMAAAPRDDRVLMDAGRGLVVAGDWLAGNRVEGAWRSGTEAGARLAALG